VIKFVSDLRQWFSPGTLVSPTNKIDHHDTTEKLLKVALNTISQPFYKTTDNTAKILYHIIWGSTFSWEWADL
jgi:hypothetical protein